MKNGYGEVYEWREGKDEESFERYGEGLTNQNLFDSTQNGLKLEGKDPFSSFCLFFLFFALNSRAKPYKMKGGRGCIYSQGSHSMMLCDT